MKVSVSYFGQIKAAVGTATEEIELDEPMSARGLVELMAALHGEAAQRMLLDASGSVQKGLLVVVNDEQILPEDSRPLQDGDRVTLMPPISGGASPRTKAVE